MNCDAEVEAVVIFYEKIFDKQGDLDHVDFIPLCRRCADAADIGARIGEECLVENLP
jgi:hypothetical protein